MLLTSLVFAKNKPTTVTGIEMFRKILDQGFAGDNAGILLRGTKREEVERGQVICKAGTVKAHTVFECKTVILSKDEGGRSKEFKAGSSSVLLQYNWMLQVVLTL